MYEPTEPVEAKVKWATSAALVTSFVLMLLNRYVPAIHDWDQELLKGVLDLSVTGVVTFWAGWQAKHTPRV